MFDPTHTPDDLLALLSLDMRRPKPTIHLAAPSTSNIDIHSKVYPNMKGNWHFEYLPSLRNLGQQYFPVIAPTGGLFKQICVSFFGLSAQNIIIIFTGKDRFGDRCRRITFKVGS